MAKLPAPRTIQVAVRQTLGADTDVLNIFHVLADTDGPYDATVLDTVAGGIFNAFTTDFLPVLSHNLVATSAIAKDISTLNGEEFTYVPGAPVAGSDTHDSLPANCALAVSWKESFSYRGGHPRTYLAGIPVDAPTSPQAVTAFFAASTTAHAASFIADVAAIASVDGHPVYRLAVVHYSLNDTPQVPPLVKLILTATVNVRIDSQRRRLGR